jgi:hypothetical protein
MESATLLHLELLPPPLETGKARHLTNNYQSDSDWSDWEAIESRK